MKTNKLYSFPPVAKMTVDESMSTSFFVPFNADKNIYK